MMERIIALQEMVPEGPRRLIGKLAGFVGWGARTTLKYGSKTLWFVVSSSVILLLPAIYEAEADQALLQEEAGMRARQEQHQLVGTFCVKKDGCKYSTSHTPDSLPPYS